MKRSVLSFCFWVSLCSIAFGQIDTTFQWKRFPPLKVDGELVSAELAGKHIRNGRFYILQGGLVAPESDCGKYVQEKIGVEFRVMHGCISTSQYEEQIKAYDEVMEAALNRRFFGDFIEFYKEEMAQCAEDHKYDLWGFE